MDHKEISFIFLLRAMKTSVAQGAQGQPFLCTLRSLLDVKFPQRSILEVKLSLRSILAGKISPPGSILEVKFSPKVSS